MISLIQQITGKVIKRINLIVQQQPTLSRSKLARIVCEWLELKDHTGQPKVTSCRIALLKLHKKGLVELPNVNQPSNFTKNTKPKREDEQIDWPEITGLLSEIGVIELVKINKGDKQLSKIWNTMMQQHHYLGSGPLCGAQMRYLIKSKTGWLGGFSFSASAWQLKARDQWIGWNEQTRKTNLNKIVNNSRFLILPTIKVKNLASHVLAKASKQLPEDWQERYGYKPVLLETFIEKNRFAGTCYKATNWQHIGETAGRGRQDRHNKADKPIKSIYMYSLTKNFKEILCNTPEGQETSNHPGQQQLSTNKKAAKPKDWVEQELSQVTFKDKRTNDRLLTITRDIYARPQANIPQACGTPAKIKATYRFFKHKETSMEKILSAHYDATVKRIAEHPVVLAVQDTSTLDYSTHPATKGLGPVGTKKSKNIGLLLHDTMTYNLDGTPLGLIDVQCWARDPENTGKSAIRHQLPITEKESNKWLKSFEATTKVQKQVSQTKIISVGDRESDIFELFQMATTAPSELLVRATHNRRLVKEQNQLYKYIQNQKSSGIQELKVPKRGNQKARTALMEIRFAEVTLKPPKQKKGLSPLTLWAVLASEINAPAGVEPLRWLLLTTLAVHTFEQACEKLTWYAMRWGIEVYHRTLKSGCKIEQRQLGDVDSIKTCLAIDMIVAWRIYFLSKLGRETPDVPCTVFFEEKEWQALVAYVNRDVKAISKPPTLYTAMRMVGSLGGFIGRKGDGEPGTQTLWRGLQRLADITISWKIFTTISPQCATNHT